MKTSYTFHVSGVHCASCKIFIEDVLGEQDGIDNVNLNLKTKTVSFESDLDLDNGKLIQMLTEKIKHNGYALSVEKKEKASVSKDLVWKSVVIGLGFLFLFYLLQKSGILNIGLGERVTPASAFIIGVIASFSSCLAVVGGLVLSLSTKLSQTHKSNVKIFSLFHVGRLVSFMVLGGVLGSIGGSVGINFTLTSILGILASTVLLLLGLNLVGVFEKKLFIIPEKFFNSIKKQGDKRFGPIILGFATFFLPCGFTQSMQVSAMSSGSFISGFLIMLFFALGTFPVLAALSFGSETFANSRYSELFFRSSGVVVIGFGLFSFFSGLASLGIISPLFSI